MCLFTTLILSLYSLRCALHILNCLPQLQNFLLIFYGQHNDVFSQSYQLFFLYLIVPNIITQLSFILAWSTFQAHVFAGNILNVGESASYPVIDGNIFFVDVDSGIVQHQTNNFFNLVTHLQIVFYMAILQFDQIRMMQV
ncbi:Hypothetical_protein [Hexamita inflata]|uniref:Hypothetical_protein n=1 Tax=Hexamita inflata TaxID=28002 RepID=A0AA86UEU6_9EUKA|nr:Hypothetical protein HINF_LOCUS36002 [Hexamita inflata]